MTFLIRIICTAGMLAAPFLGLRAVKSTHKIWAMPVGLFAAVVIGFRLLSLEAMRPIQQIAVVAGIAAVIYGLYTLPSGNTSSWNFIGFGLGLVFILRPMRGM